MLHSQSVTELVEVTGFSETSITSYEDAHCRNPENQNLSFHCTTNIKLHLLKTTNDHTVEESGVEARTGLNVTDDALI